MSTSLVLEAVSGLMPSRMPGPDETEQHAVGAGALAV